MKSLFLLIPLFLIGAILYQPQKQLETNHFKFDTFQTVKLPVDNEAKTNIKVEIVSQPASLKYNDLDPEFELLPKLPIKDLGEVESSISIETKVSKVLSDDRNVYRNTQNYSNNRISYTRSKSRGIFRGFFNTSNCSNGRCN